MATDEEIERFVTENRELVERLMASQKDKVEAAKEAGRDVARFGAISTYYAAEYARKKSEEFFVATYKTIANPDVQRHFMASSLEFLAGLTALAESAPMPSYVKDVAQDFEKNMKSAACKANKDCPAKKKKVRTPSKKTD